MSATTTAGELGLQPEEVAGPADDDLTLWSVTEASQELRGSR